MSQLDDGQLSLEIAKHPDILAREAANHAVYITADLQLKGRFPIREDLQHGDRLVVAISDADGQVVSRGYLEVDAPPKFEPIIEKNVGVIGLNRAHRATLTDEVAQ